MTLRSRSALLSLLLALAAVSVVSGHIRGQTTTLPLHVEILYNEYNFVGAFAAASLLTLLAVVTLVAKKIVKWKTERRDTDVGRSEDL